jgi:hypothetical protein
MSIAFAGVTFAGVAEEVKFDAWERADQETTSFGTIGTSSIDGGRKNRPFEVRILVYGSVATSPAMYTLLGGYETKLGKVGTFVDNGLTPKTLANCKFMELILEEGPLPTAPDGGWMAVCLFKFKQLVP